MTERQYRQMLTNRTRNTRPLFASPAVSQVLRKAARELRMRERVGEAWGRIIEPQWTGAIVQRVRDGIVTVAAHDAAACEEIRRRKAWVLRQLQQQVPGVSDVRVTPVRAFDEAEHGPEAPA